MPTITKKHCSRYEAHGKAAEIRKIYHSMQWRRLRAAYLMQHPLCEDCLLEDRATPAEEVHHIRHISYGNTTDEMKTIALDPSNLVALCADHHHKRHGKR